MVSWRLLAVILAAIPAQILSAQSASVLTYATYLGGGGTDAAAAVLTDSAGNMTVAGTRGSIAGSRTQPFNSGFITRLSANGATTASASIAGNSNVSIWGMAIDASGNVVVTGQLSVAGSLPPTAGAYQTSNATGFVAKFDSTLSKSVFVSTFAAIPMAVAVDRSGNIYVTGAAFAGFQTTSGTIQSTNHGGADAFVLKLSGDGTQALYATLLGGGDDDVGRAIAVDAGGQVLLAGDTASSDFPLAHAAQPKFGGRLAALGLPDYGDAFVARLDAAGANLVYSTYLGGSSPDIAYGIAVDSGGNAYVAGSTSSADFPVTSGAYQTTYKGEAADPIDPTDQGNAFVAKVSPQGSLLWATYLGGSNLDYAYAVTVDGAGNVYVTGGAGSSDFPYTANPIPNCRTTTGPYVAELDAAGAHLLRSTGMSGMGFDTANSIALDAGGLVYVAGETSSEVFFATPAAAQSIYGGGDSDAFVARVNLNSTLAAGATPAPFVSCVLNGASFQPGNLAFFPTGAVAPGEIVSLFGVGLGPTPAVLYPQLTAAGTVATTLGGVTVTFDGIPAPLLYVGPNQINAVVPYGINPSQGTPALTQMTVTFGAGSWGAVTMPVVAAVPGIFTYNGSGTGQASALNPDGTYNSKANPVARGQYVEFFVAGAGLMSPPMGDGSVAPLNITPDKQSVPALPVTATVRGVAAQILYAGAAPGYVSGLLQVDLIIPTTINFGDDVPLSISIGTFASQLQVTLGVK